LPTAIAKNEAFMRLIIDLIVEKWQSFSPNDSYNNYCSL
jgi:hypothetical protein